MRRRERQRTPSELLADQKRAWVQLVPDSGASREGTSSCPTLRLATFNILEDFYAMTPKHAYCPEELRSWSTGVEGGRLERLLLEIRALDADVVCLQECKPSSFYELSERLRPFGYEGHHVAQEFGVGAMPSLQEIEKGARESFGNAVFLRTSRVERLEAAGVLFADEIDGRFGGELKKKLKNLDTSAMLLKLKVGEGSTAWQLAVASTHLFWDPNWPHAKAVQAELAIRALAKMADHGRIPAVLCGDFNALPVSQANWLPPKQRDALTSWEEWSDVDKESGVFALLSRGSVLPSHPEHPDSFGRGPEDKVDKKRKCCGELRSELRLVDAYAGVEVPATTNASDFEGRLDYIFLTPEPSGLHATAVLAVPAKLGPIPDENFASDHVPLAVDLRPRR